MKVNNRFKNVVVELICLLYILLFVYAAVSKYVDYDNFKIQISQSIVISTFTNWIVWFIPITEFLIAIALVTQKWKTLYQTSLVPVEVYWKK